MIDYTNVKNELYDKCLAYIGARIAAIEEAMREAQASANNETKSSAGDKYETTRSMMQLDKMMNTKQLHEAQQVKQSLLAIDISKNYMTAQAGSLVITAQNAYFLAIGAGKVVVNDLTYWAISQDAPIGKLLVGKQVGDEVLFNKQVLKITAIY